MTSLAHFRPYASFLLRVACAWKLFEAAGHTSLNPTEGIPGYADWLRSLGFPLPTVCAVLSAYTESLGGLLILVGWQTRWAAAFLTVNFLLAVLVGHVAQGDTFTNTFPALVLLGMSIYLLLNGPGKPSIEEGI